MLYLAKLGKRIPYPNVREYIESFDEFIRVIAKCSKCEKGHLLQRRVYLHYDLETRETRIVVHML